MAKFMEKGSGGRAGAIKRQIERKSRMDAMAKGHPDNRDKRNPKDKNIRQGDTYWNV